LRNSRSTPFDKHWVNVEGTIETMIEQVTLGTLAPAQAIKEAQRKISEMENN
jgi:hypothetical protein